MPPDTDPADPDPLPPFTRVHIWQIQAVRDVLVVAAIVGLVWLGYVLRAVTVPLLVALLLAYLFEPLIARLADHPRMSRAQAVGGLLAVMVVGLALVLALLTPVVVGETVKLVRDVQEGDLRRNAMRAVEHLPEGTRDPFMRFVEVLPGGDTAPRVAVGTDGEAVVEPPPVDPTVLTEQRVRELVAEEVAAGPEDGPDWLHVARGSARAVGQVLTAVLGIGLLTFLIPFYFFFFSLWYPAVIRFGRSMIPERNRTHTLTLLKKMDLVVSGFVRGRIIISLIMGVMLAIGWMICGVPYAIVVGLVIGIFCAVPYLGTIGVPIAAGLLFFDRLGEPHASSLWWLWALLFPTLVFVIVQLIEGWLLTPMIAGKATGLDPVTILVAVLAGGSVLGVYGMLLAIPIAACLKILFTEVFLPRIQAWTRGETPDFLPIGRR